MHINAFVPTESPLMVGNAVNATQVPFTAFRLPPLKEQQVHQLSAPILLCLWAENGADHDPRLYVQARDPNSETRGNAELVWFWEDVPDAPCKWRVFDPPLPFLVFGDGVYTFGVYSDPDDPTEDALASYPLTIIFDPDCPPLPSGRGLPPGAEYR